MLTEYSKEEIFDEPLIEVPIDKWTDLQKAFKEDWLTSVLGGTVLWGQRKLIERGFRNSFKVFCPFGKASSGMVAFNTKNEYNEIVVQCPTNDTRDLEDALKRTKLIDWRKNIVIPFAPIHVIDCFKRFSDIDTAVGVELMLLNGSISPQRRRIPFEVSLPPGITFGVLSLEHAELVNSCWPHKYPDSVKYFQMLIKAKTGFGLFRDHQLLSWIFINENGTLLHLYTIEEERRKGLADLILKMVCNIVLREEKDVVAFCVKGNVSSRNLFEKTGFMLYDCGISWYFMKPKDD